MTIEDRVANSSEKNRNFFTATMVIFLYLIVVVLQTTDSDLLVGRGVRLPLVDVDMPLFAFFIAAPVLVFVLHFNLLQNIEGHYLKLNAWKNSIKGVGLDRASIYPFIFDFAILDQQSAMARYTRFAAQMTIFWSGPIVMLLIFWRFTDYQDVMVTLMHFFFFVLDVWIVAKFRGEIFKSVNAKVKPLKKSGLDFVMCFLNWQSKGVSGQTYSNIFGVLIWVGCLIQLVLFLITLNVNSTFIGINSQQVILPEFMLARISIDPSENLLVVDQHMKLLHELDNQEFTDLEFERLRESQGRLEPYKYSFYEWFAKHGVGLKLEGRSLRYSSLVFADLRRARLQNAVLVGANLQGARLQSASLDYAQLQGAKLDWAEFSMASMKNIQIDHSSSFINCTKDSYTNLSITKKTDTSPVEYEIDNEKTADLVKKMRAVGWP